MNHARIRTSILHLGKTVTYLFGTIFKILERSMRTSYCIIEELKSYLHKQKMKTPADLGSPLSGNITKTQH